MNYNTLKNRFLKLGYYVSYINNLHGQGYYIQKIGSTNFSFFEPSRSRIEELLDKLECERLVKN